MRKLFYFPLLFVIGLMPVFCTEVENTKVAGDTSVDTNDSLVQSTGLIAYIRNDNEIRVIDSTGQNDKQIWTHEDAKAPFGIFDIAWRPDGKELAFSSGHQNMQSLFHADLYAIRPDGSGLRRLTNLPDPKNFSSYKKGSVTVTLRNNQYSFQKAQSSTGLFTVYIAGADMPQQVLLPPGATKTIEFKNVADFGDHAQPVVAIYGQTRWFIPGTDVVAGKSIKAPEFIISGDGYDYFGAFRPVWKQDGSKLSYRDGLCLVKTVPVRPAVGAEFNHLFGNKETTGSCYWDWGPTPNLSNHVLYLVDASEETSGFYMRKEGDHSETPVPLHLSPHGAYDLKWLPDGSGFVYSMNYYRETDSKRVSNIFRYDIASKKNIQVTDLEDGYARQFSVSPSGRWIVYEKCSIDQDRPDDLDFKGSDLWIIGVDGKGDRLLVKNGMAPSWSR